MRAIATRGTSSVLALAIAIGGAAVLQAGCLEPALDNDSELANTDDETVDPETAQLERQASDDAEVAAKDTAGPDDIAATPTCNWVAAFAGAWVPMHLATNSVNCNMVRGTNSEAVKKLQHSMNLCYREHLVEDGDFGGNTEAALRRTQRAAGTGDDGQYGPNTRRAMLHQAIAGGCIRVP